ncbi:hypothetical protein GCM10008013_28610 [Paenibacillus segetis]|uniref:Uncharacterized protein n=1 Tax=Paenibacillus segetis TaxID=1325360 RepID=A0ABQ1YIJ0_9BACL|nr:DUF6886 family protein [Paenibacillus segetis]GGH27269.1 hypothetical protein GCM10008013_28610 [Paenibacillus segetis]
MFIPRPNKSFPHLEPAVWAIDQEHAVHYFFPRDCPRVIYWKADNSTIEDREQFFRYSTVDKIMVVENGWMERLRTTKLYVYVFAPEDFHWFEEAKTAGYYISHKEVKPLRVEVIDDLLGSMMEQDIELRFTPNLSLIKEAVINSSLDFSIIRYANAVK